MRFAAKAAIDRIISRWALEDLRAPLDYVYTSTEPTRGAAFGENLDSSTIRRGIHVNRPTRHLRLAKDRSRLIQELLQRRGDQPEKLQITLPRYDEVYSEAIKAVDQSVRQARRRKEHSGDALPIAGPLRPRSGASALNDQLPERFSASS